MKIQKKVLLKLKYLKKIWNFFYIKIKKFLRGREVSEFNHLIMSTLFTIEEIIKSHGPWVIYDGQNWKKIYDFNLAVQIIFIKN